MNHLLPGIFFLCSTTIIACGYGLGFAEVSTSVTSDSETEEAPLADPVETPLEASRS